MNADDTIKTLLADASKTAECRDARMAWARRTSAAWRDARREMDDRCCEAVVRLDEEAFERFCDAEQAKVAAIMAELRAAIDEDRWPRELYVGGI